MLIFIIQAYNKKDELGNLKDVATLELFAKNADEAIARAEKLIAKEQYRISGIIEKEA